MKKLFKKLLCSVLSVGLLLSCAGALAAGPVKNQVVLLKFDDLVQENADAFQRVADLLAEEGVPGSFGIIGNSLEGDNQEYFDTIKAWDAQGIELWHHGYTSAEKEYLNDDYDAQYESFKKTMDLMKEKCGITMHSFCLPWGNGTDTTLRMLNEFPEITSTLVAPQKNDIMNAVSFDTRANLEISTGKTDYNSFVEQYRLQVSSPYIVIQCHPAMWQDSDFDNLRAAIHYLKEKGCVFNTPTAYVDDYKAYLENPPVDDSIYIRLDKEYMMNLDVEPQMINDRVMVPFRAIFEALGADIEWNADTATATASKGSTVVQITENSATAIVNGVENALDAPATIVQDRFLVPIRFVSEAFGAVVYWSEDENTVVIRTIKDGCTYTLSEGQLAIAGCTWSDAFQDEIGPMTYDGDIDSVWSAEGTDVWVCYDLGSVCTLDHTEIMWNKGDVRQQKYEILVSQDGETFESIYDGLASGTAVNEYETTKLGGAEARYVKVLCKGNIAGETEGTWNAIKEIKFFGAPVEGK